MGIEAGMIMMMWWPQAHAGHLHHHPVSEEGQHRCRHVEVKCIPGHKYQVNTPAVISQVQTTHKEARRNKTASKLFKMFLIMLLVLSLSMMIQSAPAETEKESRQIRCFFECPAYVYGPVCGVENNTFPNTCFLECHGEQLACDGECPCPKRGPNKAPNKGPK